MLPPEVLRIVLLIGLAATGYLMILAWNDDLQESRQQVVYDEAPLSVDAGQSVVPSGSSSTSSNTPSDLPDSSTLVRSENVNPTLADPTPTSQAAGGLLEITTPTLKVWIDLRGGDIVRVQLPTYPLELDQPDIPFQLLERSASQTYVAQSGLIGPNGPDASGQRPLYSVQAREVQLAAGETKDVVLTTQSGQALIEKVFTFRADDFLVDVTYRMQNQSDQAMTAGMFALINRDSKPAPTDESFALAPQPYLGAATTKSDERYYKIEFDDIDEDGEYEERGQQGGWIAFLQHYFLAAWISPEDQTNNYFGKRIRDGTYQFGFTGPAKSVAPGATQTWQAHFYAGPKDQKRLEQISANLNLTVDYGFLWWLAVPLFYLLDWLHELVGNWGFAIILLTVVVKAVLYPLSAAGYKSMANMRRVAPAMKKLQERYANDREKLSREMMALYKKEGANPLGGCLPMLLPMPIFLALYWVLFESVELRQAPFVGWIQDLASMDPFFVLPLLMGASMYWMQSMNPQIGDPMQVKMMKMMPIMFTVLFLFFPAGLVLYWLVNNVLSVAQQQYVYRRADLAQAAKA